MEMVIALSIGMTIGIVLGLTGAGGSIFAVPLFLLFTQLSVADAMGVSLAAVAVSAIFATVTTGYKIALWVPAILLSLGGMLTAPLGKWAAIHIDDSLLLMGFSLLAFIIGIRMWLQSIRSPEESRIVRASPTVAKHKPEALLCRLSHTGQFELEPGCFGGLVVGGLGIGFVSGLFGVGGGFLIIPLLMYLSQLKMHVAVATSLVVIALISSVGFASHLYFSSEIVWMLLVQVMVASIFGMTISQIFSQKIASFRLQQIFSISLIFVTLITLIGRIL